MDEPVDRIPLFEIDWNKDDITHAVESIGRGGYWAKGPYVSEFETQLEGFFDVDHALVVNSGTTALIAALESLGISRGDEVIVPSFTFIATANAVKLVGGEPVFADIEPHTYGLDPDDVRSRITDDTAAILPVHCYGTSCQIEELSKVANNYDLHLVEDAAEVFGAEYRDQPLGTFGDVAALSFCQNKILPTGEGGAVITDDDDLAEQIRLYRSHGRASSNYFENADSGEYVDVGTNIRMSDLTAAIGCSQFDRVDSLIEGRQEAAERLNEGFANVDGVSPHEPMERATHVYQLYTVELAETIDRDEVIETLDEHGIASKVYWDPAVHRTKCYREEKNVVPDLPVTEDVSSRVLSLPMHPNLSPQETSRIVEAVTTAVEQS